MNLLYVFFGLFVKNIIFPGTPGRFPPVARYRKILLPQLQMRFFMVYLNLCI